MDIPSQPQKASQPAPAKPKRRIQTQIHRRNKAKAVLPFTDEWEASSPEPPPNLRMPSKNMEKSSPG